jgi:hypothetical protein
METTLAQETLDTLRRPYGTFYATKPKALIKYLGGFALWFHDGSLIDAGQVFHAVSAWALARYGRLNIDGLAIAIEGEQQAIERLLDDLYELGIHYRVRTR